jgi:hypothetical protein
MVRPTELALAAKGDAEEDVLADLKAVANASADVLDDAGAFVSSDDRRRAATVAVPCRQVGMADAGGDHADDELIVSRVTEPDELDGALAQLASDDGFGFERHGDALTKGQMLDIGKTGTGSGWGSGDARCAPQYCC